MNCFHFYIFDISETVPEAIKLVAKGCELLSFLYLWHIRNSIAVKAYAREEVVNCFHFYIFDISETVTNNHEHEHTSCELLSFLYLWHIRNSYCKNNFIRVFVVNCFHFYIFDISETVEEEWQLKLEALWIAFIFISLTYQKQLVSSLVSTSCCCELLSFLYLWHIRNSNILGNHCHLLVVNCFHFYIFDISETVSSGQNYHYTSLWIAFIFISLTYQKQFLQANIFSTRCCELLSFLYLWHIRNSKLQRIKIINTVVNCFHFYIFDISETVNYSRVVAIL